MEKIINTVHVRYEHLVRGKPVEVNINIKPGELESLPGLGSGQPWEVRRPERTNKLQFFLDGAATDGVTIKALPDLNRRMPHRIEVISEVMRRLGHLPDLDITLTENDAGFLMMLRGTVFEITG